MMPDQNQITSRTGKPGNTDGLKALGVFLAVFLGLLWYFGLVLILWLLLAAVGIAAIACGLAALGTKDKDTRNGFAAGVVACSIAAYFLWGWIGSWNIQIPALPKSADAQQITAAYRDRVAFIQLGFTTTESHILWQENVTNGDLGSGILLANDRTQGVILTNRHVIDPVYAGAASNLNSLAVRVRLASEKDWHVAKIAAIHRTLDLALIAVDLPFSSKGAVRVASHLRLQQGEPVVALGNPLGIDFVTTQGIISKIATDGVLTSCPISPGNSGGPLILQRYGLVAGINTFAYTEGQNLNGAVLAEWGVRRYPPASGEAKPVKRSRGLLAQVVEGVVRQLVTQSPPADDCWDWWGDRQQVTSLLAMVPVVEE